MELYSYPMVIDQEIRVSRRPLRSNAQTAAAMYSMVDKYANDLRGVAKLPLSVFFRRVANLPYSRDPQGVERVARPRIGVRLAGRTGIDCKKKSVLVASWLKLNKIPFRFIGASEQKKAGGLLGMLGLFGKPKIHHVFPQGLFCNGESCKWRNVDATYPNYELFEPKPAVTRAVIFGRG